MKRSFALVLMRSEDERCLCERINEKGLEKSSYRSDDRRRLKKKSRETAVFLSVNETKLTCLIVIGIHLFYQPESHLP